MINQVCQGSKVTAAILLHFRTAFKLTDLDGEMAHSSVRVLLALLFNETKASL